MQRHKLSALNPAQLAPVPVYRRQQGAGKDHDPADSHRPENAHRLMTNQYYPAQRESEPDQ